MTFHAEKDLALCGLACALCSNEDCPGCKDIGCGKAASCTVYRCAAEKGLDGCYLCDKFPCGEEILQGVRNRAFNKYARQFGKVALLERLKDNCANGIVYHRPDGLTGDYDLPATEDEIMQLIQFGRNNPYRSCPSFDTGHFAIRLVEKEDAEDLFVCYGDHVARRLLNNDNCKPFEFTLERMPEVVRAWLDRDYARGDFIRFSIVEKKNEKAVGTIEIYDRKCQRAERTTGILRIDIASKYESEEYLSELMALSNRIFFDIFHSENILMKAIPEAVERIAALKSNGFLPIDIPGREHYYMRQRADRTEESALSR